MKNKKGFIFVETIIVISILSIGLMFMYRVFTNITATEQRRLKYDNSVYLYRSYHITNFLTQKGAIEQFKSTNNNTEISCSSILLLPDEFQFCNLLMTNLAVEKIYLLKPNFKENINPFPARERRYLRTIDDSGYRIFIVFKEDYYASLKVVDS